MTPQELAQKLHATSPNLSPINIERAARAQNPDPTFAKAVASEFFNLVMKSGK